MKNTKNIKRKKKHPKREKNMNENFTTTQKYEKYCQNAKEIENIKKNKNKNMRPRCREAGETPATLAAPTENRIIVGLAPSIYYSP